MAHPYPTSRNETQQVPTYGLLSTTQQPQQTGRSRGEVSLLPPNNHTSGNGPRTDNPITHTQKKWTKDLNIHFIKDYV